MTLDFCEFNKYFYELDLLFLIQCVDIFMMSIVGGMGKIINGLLEALMPILQLTNSNFFIRNAMLKENSMLANVPMHMQQLQCPCQPSHPHH